MPQAYGAYGLLEWLALPRWGQRGTKLQPAKHQGTMTTTRALKHAARTASVMGRLMNEAHIGKGHEEMQMHKQFMRAARQCACPFQLMGTRQARHVRTALLR